MSEFQVPDGIELKRFDGEILFRPDDGTDGPWWTWDELRDAVLTAHRSLTAAGLIETEQDMTETSPTVQRFQKWAGYIIGSLIIACFVVVILAATFAAVRALLW